MDLKDVASERAVLSGIIQYSQGYLDVCDIIQSDCFTTLENQTLYTVLSYIRTTNLKSKIDQHLILSTAKDLNLQQLITNDDQYLGRMINFKVELDNIRDYAKRVKRLKVYRELYGTGSDAFQELLKLNGSEPLIKALAIVEKPIFDFINNLTVDNSSAVEQIGVGLTEYLDNLEANPLEVIGIPLPFKIYQEAIGGMAEGVHVITARPKVGKAQPLDAIIHTVNGPKFNKDIKIGDLICTDNGKYAKVTHIHPQGYRSVYNITFKDGDSVECDEEHLWKIKSRRWKEYRVISLKEILNTKIKESDRYKWQIPLPKPAYYYDQNVAIDPYMMGLLLGDGSFRGGVKFTTKDIDLVNCIESILLKDYHCNSVKGSKYGYLITAGRTGRKNIYIQYLKQFGLYNKKSKDKFIPECYLYNSYQTRLSLLQGLMDTDGYCKKRNFEYSTSSEVMANNVKFLVNSLGGICKIKKRKTRYTKKDKSKSKWFDSYRVIMYFNNGIMPFRLNRKINESKNRTKPELKRVIKNIEYIGKKQCQCITIDNSDGLYLTNNFVITHNSTVAVNIALHVAIKEKIPVLFLDTELRKESGQWARLLARISGVEFFNIRSGQYSQNELKRKKVRKAEQILKSAVLDYANITGREFDEVISMVRRWLIQKVGYNAKGELKPCLLIYDYLKLTGINEKKNLQEYEAIGYRLSGLHDLSMSYKFPCLTFCQLNREFDVSQSDRIRWYCTSLAALMKKEEEELAEDGRENGNRKLILQDCRFGEGLEDGDYINMQLDGKTTTLIELQTRNQLNRNRNEQALEPAEVNENF